ncbi:unnamed protein product [Larinioides sclopetarius]|uniref:Uncharacterized protein n=1 Tax=Larinioides sclopetarius TaxID=280406 RepID=A0AAV1ZKP9_9ARAC
MTRLYRCIAAAGSELVRQYSRPDYDNALVTSNARSYTSPISSITQKITLAVRSFMDLRGKTYRAYRGDNHKNQHPPGLPEEDPGTKQEPIHRSTHRQPRAAEDVEEKYAP